MAKPELVLRMQPRSITLLATALLLSVAAPVPGGTSMPSAMAAEAPPASWQVREQTEPDPFRSTANTERTVPLPQPAGAADPIAATIEQRDALRVQAIMARPCCDPVVAPGPLSTDIAGGFLDEGVVPVQDRESCLFLPTYCGPIVCAPRPDWLAGGRFFVMTDLIALKRDQSGSVPFATLDNETVLRTEERTIPFRYGMRFLTGFSLTPWNRIEGLYLGLTDWVDSAAIRNDSPNALGGDGNLFSRLSNFGNPPIVGVDYDNEASIYYRSVFDNVELNWRHRLPAPAWMEASFLFGARYISVRERFLFSTVSEVPGPQGTSNDVNTGSGNDLIGAQIGGTVNAPISDAWWIELELKGALCQNSAAQTTVYTYTDQFGVSDDYTTSKRATTTAYVGDLSLSIFCQCTDHIAVRFGYQAIWIDGLALASENVPLNVNVLTQGPAGLVDDGNVVYHGPHAGLMICW